MHRRDFTKAHAAFKRGWHLDTKNAELTKACQEALEAMAQVDREGSMRRAAAAGYTHAAAPAPPAPAAGSSPAVHEQALPVPQHSLEELGEEFVLRVQLPSVTNLEQVELNASDTHVEVAAPEAGYGNLRVELPAPVDEGRTAAKFNKKSSELVLRLPRVAL